MYIPDDPEDDVELVEAVAADEEPGADDDDGAGGRGGEVAEVRGDVEVSSQVKEYDPEGAKQ